MLVICTFKSLCGIVFGCGVAPEIDLVDYTKDTNSSNISNTTDAIQAATNTSQDEDESKNVSTAIIADTQKIMQLLKSGWQEEDSEQPQEQLFVNAETSEASNTNPTSAAIPTTSINNNNSTSSSSSSSPPSLTTSGNVLTSSNNSNLNINNNSNNNNDISRYIGKYFMQHVDFDVKAKNYNIFRSQDYCWKEDGFELVRRFLPGAAMLLDEEFDHIYTMTYNRFNESENVDTFPFRRAVWQYVQRIKGVFHDDYNYQEVNIFLNKENKSYIKKIACYPETISKSDFSNLGYQLGPDEKVHIGLLSVESAKQSELLYGLHAVMKYMYNQ